MKKRALFNSDISNRLNGKGKFLHSAVSGPRDCSKRFTLTLVNMFIPKPTQLLWEVFSHAAIRPQLKDKASWPWLLYILGGTKASMYRAPRPVGRAPRPVGRAPRPVGRAPRPVGRTPRPVENAILLQML